MKLSYFQAAQEENASLHREVEAFGQCQARISELEYHNNALRMISKQQLPKIKEKAEKAMEDLKAAQMGVILEIIIIAPPE